MDSHPIVRDAAPVSYTHLYNMMNEGQKWVINADVLHWINDNYETLKHAKLIGQTPAKGTPYGYSAWSEQEGIISVRNTSDEVKEDVYKRQGYRAGSRKR